MTCKLSFSLSDPEGLIFGAGIGNEVIKLYDLRSFDKVILSKFYGKFQKKIFCRVLSTLSILDVKILVMNGLE